MHLDFERIAFGTVVGVTGAAVALTRYRWPLTETRGEPREAMIEKSGSQKGRPVYACVRIEEIVAHLTCLQHIA